MAEPGGPVTHDAPCAPPQHPRAQVALIPPRQDQQPGVVRHQMKASVLGAEVPPDPAVACPTLQRRGREHRQGEPHTVTMRDVPQRLSDLGQRPEIMVRLHQLLEPSFLLGADDIDDDFRQSHRSASAPEGLVRVTSYHENAELTRLGGNILKILKDSAGTDPPWCTFRSGSRDLGRVDAPSGSLIAYSAAPSKVTTSGKGGNSPYTAASAVAMTEPGLKIGDVFKRVRVAANSCRT